MFCEFQNFYNNMFHFLAIRKTIQQIFFSKGNRLWSFLSCDFEKSELKNFHLALRRFHLILPLLNNATNFICNVLHLPLDRKLPNSGEGRCTLYAGSLINFKLFFATCYQQHLPNGLDVTKEAFRGRKLQLYS